MSIKQNTLCYWMSVSVESQQQTAAYLYLTKVQNKYRQYNNIEKKLNYKKVSNIKLMVSSCHFKNYLYI